MKSILEDLWYGNISPIERGCYNTSELKNLLHTENEYRHSLEATLSDEQKALLEKMLDCRCQMDSITEKSIFIYGFRLGAQLMTSALSSIEE